MIAYLEGRLAEKHPTHFIIDIGGVGFHVQVPLSSYEDVDVVDGTVKVLTHLHVREDVMALYGFATMAERDLFELLIGVSGIGPPMALKILSGTPISDFKRMVAAEDSKGLTRIKGVGPKLAQRLVLEIRDKIDSIAPEAFRSDAIGLADPDILAEATAALAGLGANPVQARKVVATVLQDMGDDATIEQVIKRALRSI
ncbi:MAG: Holliday junction DNA helicase RuvA [Candidatus Latescibacterota bacterium]|jgi:Holliday junction DNA helicase RuvA